MEASVLRSLMWQQILKERLTIAPMPPPIRHPEAAIRVGEIPKERQIATNIATEIAVALHPIDVQEHKINFQADTHLTLPVCSRRQFLQSDQLTLFKESRLK